MASCPAIHGCVPEPAEPRVRIHSASRFYAKEIRFDPYQLVAVHQSERELARRALDGEDWPALLDLDGYELRTYNGLWEKVRLNE